MNIHKSLKRFVSPPRLQDEEQSRIAAILYVSAIAILAGLFGLVLYRLLAGEFRLIPPFLVMCGMIYASLILVRRGLVAWSANLLAWALLGFLNYMIALHDGIHDTAVLALPGVLVLAGLVLEKRSFLVFTAASLFFIGMIGYLEVNGVIQNSYVGKARYSEILDVVVILGLTALMVRLVADNLVGSLALARKNEKALQAQADQLKESEHSYRTLFESARDAILIMDHERVLQCNGMTLEMFGCKGRAEIIGHSPWEFSPPRQSDGRESKERALESIQAVLEGTPQRFYWKHCRRDGSLFDAEVSLSTLESGDGAFIQAMVRDITKRKQAEDALREKEMELDRYFTNALDLLCIADTDGYFRRVNKEWESALGYPAEELEGKRFLDYVHPDDRKATLRTIAQLNDQKAVLNFANRCRSKDGSYRWIEWRSFPAGKLIYAAARDITDRKRMEDALRRSEERFRALVEATSDWIWEVDEHNRYTYSSPKIKDVLGYSPEEIIGKTPADLMPAEEAKRIGAYVKERAEQKLPFSNLENMNIHKDGRTVVLETSAIPVLDATGHLQGYRGIDRDITDRKALEVSLRQSEEKFAKAFHSSPDSITISDIDTGELLEANKGFERVFGHSRDEVIGKSTLELGLYANLADRARMIQILKREGKVRELEMEGRRKSGESLTGLLSVETIEVGGKPLMVTTVRDITDRLAAEQALRDSEEHFRLFMDHFPGLAYIKDSSGRMLFASEGFRTQVGIAPETIIGKTNAEAFPPEFAGKITADDRRVLATGQSEQVEELLEDRIWSTYKFVLPQQSGPLLLGGITLDITDRKLAEDSLRKSEAFLDTVIEHSPYSMWVSDSEGTMIRMNQACRDLLHVTDEELVGKYNVFRDTVVEKQGAMPIVRRVFENGEEVQFTLTYDSSQLRSIPLAETAQLTLEVTISPVLDAERRVVHAIIQHKDMTERRRVEEALQKSEQQNKAIAEMTTDYVFVVDVDDQRNLKLRWASENLVQLTGRTINDAATSDLWKQIIHPDDVGYFFAFVDRMSATAQSGEIECRSITKFGTERWIHVFAKSGAGENNRVMTIVGAAKDITERKQADKALREREFLLRKSQEVGDLGSYYFDISTGNITTSEKLDDIFGIDSGYQKNLEGWMSLMHPDDREVMLQHLTDHVLARHNRFDQEYRIIRHRDKEERWLHGLGELEFDGSGSPVKMIGTIQDITERKRAEEKLRANEDRLFAVIDRAPFGAHSYELHSDGRLILLGGNKSADRTLGIDHSVLIGKTIEEAFPGLKGTPIPDTYRRVAATGESFETDNVEYEEGRIRGAFEIHAFQTGLNRMSVFFRDITERKKAEMALRASESQFRELWGATVEGIAIHEGGKIVEVNDAMCRMFGYERDQAIGKSIIDFAAPEIHDLIRERLASGREETVEIPVLRADGTKLMLEVFAKQITYNSKPVRMVATRDITERKRAEEVIKESEANLNALINNRSESIWSVDRDYAYTTFNQFFVDAYFATYGTKLEKGMNAIGILTPELRTFWKPRYDSALAGQRTVFEFSAQSGDNLISYEISLNPILSDGTVTGVSALSVDISGRKRAEELLKRYQLLSQNTRDIILFVRSSDGHILEANEAAVRAYGYTREELTTKRIHELRAPETMSGLTRQMEEASLQGISFETYHRRQDGTAFPVEVNAQGMSMGDDHILLSIIRDITERKRAENTLRMFQYSIDQAFDAVFWMTRTGGFSYVNNRACTSLGYTREELMRLHLWDIDPLYPQHLWSSNWVRYQENRQGGNENLESVHKRKDETTFPVDVTSTHLWLGDDELHIAVVRDITERKQTDEQIHRINQELEGRVADRTAALEAANKELEAFAYSVSHDLRAPLRAIDGYSRILVEDHGASLDSEGQRVCSVIHEETKRMGGLIDDLLAFSRLSRSHVVQSEIDMTALVNSVFSELTTPEVRKRLDFRMHSIPKAMGDPHLIRQVWTNLFSNAIKFSSRQERPTVEVNGRESGNEIVYSVTDNGAGFDMQYAGKLFGVFQRLHSTREFEGTGVGLAIVQRIIHRHGGRVWAEGQPDQGATFYFTIPWKGT